MIVAYDRRFAAAVLALLMIVWHWVANVMDCEDVRALLGEFGGTTRCKWTESQGTSPVPSAFHDPVYLSDIGWPENPASISVVSSVTQIPKIVHQAFDSRVVPVQFTKWMETWTHTLGEADWTFVFWTLADVRQLVASEYPHYLDLFDGYPKSIMRWDMARCLILHRYGGVYADVDFELFTSLEPFLASSPVMLLDSPQKKWEDVQNSLIASAPRHQFWAFVFQTLLDRRPSPESLWADVVATTGPGMLSEALRRWNEQAKQDDSPASTSQFKGLRHQAHHGQLAVDDGKHDGAGVGRFDFVRFLYGEPSKDGPAVARHHYAHRYLWVNQRETIKTVLSWVALLFAASWVSIELAQWGRQSLLMRAQDSKKSDALAA